MTSCHPEGAPLRTRPYPRSPRATEGSSFPGLRTVSRRELSASDPRGMHTYYVYILASVKRTLYIGVTNDLRRRLYEHKTGAVPGFTTRYKVDRFVYFEAVGQAETAIQREKQLKGWVRKRKLELIESQNPEWEDLADRAGLPEMVARTS